VGAGAVRALSAAQLQALRAGDEQAFRELVREHESLLLRLALLHAPSRAVAEEVVQETWVAVLRGLDGFEGRASLKTWISRILVNVARRRAGREGRSLPFSSLAPDEDSGPSVDPDRFFAAGPYAGHWLSFPTDWSQLPEERILAKEVRAVVDGAIERLAPAQRAVITLRDLEGWSAAEASELLGVADGHQRVLLHRARTQVREALERYFDARDL
jgi:RNA polymerase sigma-70 factor, ECF subfamily